MEILKNQRNQLYDLIELAGLTPLDFSMENHLELIYIPEEKYYFFANEHSNCFALIEYSPGITKILERGYDWRNLFIGTMISVVLQLSLSQEQGKELWDLIKSVFHNYFLL